MFEHIGLYALLFPIAYLGATLTFYALSYLNLSPHASFLARVLASYATLTLCALYGVLASLYLRLVGNHRNSQWAAARAFNALMWYTTGVRFRIVAGSEHLTTRPMVLVGNHQSALDILFLAAIWPRWCSVTAKKSLAPVPVLGWFMSLSGTVFIDRSDRQSAIKAFEGAAREMREERQSVFIFPEGTRRAGPRPVLGGFKKGAFHLAVQAQVPVVAVVCANYWGVCAVGEGRFASGEVPVKVLPPIPTTGLTADDVDDLTNRVREMMLRELVALSETPLGRMAIGADVEPVEENLSMATPSGVPGAGINGGRKAVASGVDR